MLGKFCPELPFDLEELFWLGMDRNIPTLQNQSKGLALNLGAGNKVIEDTIPLDYPNWDADIEPLPFVAGEVGVIHAYHFLEHIKNSVAMLQEFQLVRVP